MEAPMPIAQPVGPDQPNARADVRILQRLLNGQPSAPGLVEDGLYGINSWTALAASRPDGDDRRPVTPRGDDVARLIAGLPVGAERARFGCVFAEAASDRLARFHPALSAAMRDAGIDTSLRRAHFLAQIAHESGGLRWLEELASGQAYEGRADLGNDQPGDGPRFKGRGLIQLTGRANYTAFARDLGRDLTSSTEAAAQVAADPDLCVRAATWFWSQNHLNALADADDLEAVTRRINGGLNGLEDRAKYLARAKAVFPDPVVA
jgi:putative chitinase